MDAAVQRMPRGLGGHRARQQRLEFREPAASQGRAVIEQNPKDFKAVQELAALTKALATPVAVAVAV